LRTTERTSISGRRGCGEQWFGDDLSNHRYKII